MDAELIRGSNGIFEVAVDGVVVAAKTRTGFPGEAVVVDAVAKVVGDAQG